MSAAASPTPPSLDVTPADAPVICTITTGRGHIEAFVYENALGELVARARFAGAGAIPRNLDPHLVTAFMFERVAGDVSHRIYHRTPHGRLTRVNLSGLPVEFVADLRRALAAALAMVGK